MRRSTVTWISLVAAAVIVAHSVMWDYVRWRGGGLIADNTELVTIGAAKANWFRLALVADMLGSFLLTLPATLALWRMLRADHDRELVDVLAVGGVLLAFVGAAAAANLAYGGEPLIRQYAAGVHRDAAATAFGALQNGAAGVWQGPVALAGGVWWAGSGWLLRRRWKWFAAFSVALGVAGAALAMARIAGVGTESSAPGTLAFAPTAIWIGWLGVNLGRASREVVTPLA